LPKKVDPLKAEKYKQARLQGKSIKGSMLEAGYTEATAHHSSTEGVVKRCEPELMAEVKASDISVDWVISKLNQEMVKTDCRASDRVRILELLGKYLNMFKDSQSTQTIVFTGDIVKDLPPIDIESVNNSKAPIDIEPMTQPPNNVGVTTS